MEMNKSNVGFFSIEPPKLEDAGLEDPALPIEDIQEAFKRAADIAMRNNTVLNVDSYNEEVENVDSDDTKEQWKSPIDLFTASTIMPNEVVIVDPQHHLPTVVLNQNLVKETCTLDRTKAE